MNDNSSDFFGQAASFQKIWLDSMTKMTQVFFNFGPESVPPEMARQVRSGVFQALSKSWDEFLRSPQFLESTKQWMDNAITFRKMSNDFMTAARNEMQATSKDDIDSVMLTVRHMEQRILDRIETLADQVAHLQEQVGTRPNNGSALRTPAAARPPRRKARRTQRAKQD